MDMHQVRYAVALARTLNFTRAAEQCNVSQPSLSRAIQKLEDEFGGPLFLRERSLTNLTELGRATIPHLERTLESAEAAKAQALEFRRQDKPILNLGLAHGLSIGPIAAAIGELGRKMAGFSLTVVDRIQENLVDSLLTGELEVAVIERAGDLPERLDSCVVAREGFAALMRPDHPLASFNQVTAENLRQEALIVQKKSTLVRLLELESANSGTIPLLHLCADLAQAKELVRAGLGIAIIPSTSVCEADLVTRLICDMNSVREISLSSVCGRRQSLAVSSLIRLVRARGIAA
jgi:DNA-binding transcriptional LysR family regulator